MIPSAERLKTSADSRPGETARLDASQTPCTASKPITGSLARSHSPAGVEFDVSEGRRPERQVRPASRDVAKPMFAAAPSRIRPTWKTETIVDPNA